ncbi:unnamed protein product, partial [Ectocarpus sp. 4 AP-2014]
MANDTRPLPPILYADSPFLETGINFSQRHGHTSRRFNTDGNPLALPLYKRRTDGRIHDKSELATIMFGHSTIATMSGKSGRLVAAADKGGSIAATFFGQIVRPEESSLNDTPDERVLLFRRNKQVS